MKHFNKSIGSYGENLAENYLKESNYKIIDMNFRCKIGEIDIIAKNDGYICFIEVKSRYNTTYGYPREAVTRSKQLKIYKTAKMYILENKLINQKFRFDVIEIMFNYKNNDNSILLLKNAFQFDEF